MAQLSEVNMPKRISSLLAVVFLLGGCQPFEGDDVGECSDRADNDADGLYDCNDPDCAGSPDCED